MSLDAQEFERGTMRTLRLGRWVIREAPLPRGTAWMSIRRARKPIRRPFFYLQPVYLAIALVGLHLVMPLSTVSSRIITAAVCAIAIVAVALVPQLFRASAIAVGRNGSDRLIVAVRRFMRVTTYSIPVRGVRALRLCDTATVSSHHYVRLELLEMSGVRRIVSRDWTPPFAMSVFAALNRTLGANSFERRNQLVGPATRVARPAEPFQGLPSVAATRVRPSLLVALLLLCIIVAAAMLAAPQPTNAGVIQFLALQGLVGGAMLMSVFELFLWSWRAARRCDSLDIGSDRISVLDWRKGRCVRERTFECKSIVAIQAAAAEVSPTKPPLREIIFWLADGTAVRALAGNTPERIDECMELTRRCNLHDVFGLDRASRECVLERR